MNNRQIERCLQFLHDTTLKGHDVQDFNEVVGALLALANTNAIGTPMPPPPQFMHDQQPTNKPV